MALSAMLALGPSYAHGADTLVRHHTSNTGPLSNSQKGDAELVRDKYLQSMGAVYKMPDPTWIA